MDGSDISLCTGDIFLEILEKYWCTGVISWCTEEKYQEMREKYKEMKDLSLCANDISLCAMELSASSLCKRVLLMGQDIIRELGDKCLDLAA
jgi:hypothetical protein